MRIMGIMGIMGMQWMVGGAAVVLVLASAGCDGFGEEMESVTRAFNPTTPTEAAVMAANQTSSDDRRRGTTLLANAPFGGEEPYMALYRDYVQNDPDPLVKASAVRGLGRHGEPADALLVAPLLAHESPVVRWEAAKALQRIHNPAVVPTMLASLRSEQEEPSVRVAVARALGQYPEDRVFQVLVGALDARELAVNRAAQHALHVLTGEDHGLDSRAWLDWYDDAVLQGDVLANGEQYVYPTYRRKIGWVERLAFWSPKTFEQPAPPAGLRPDDERRTYESDAPVPE